jgi:hypothetical protein
VVVEPKKLDDDGTNAVTTESHNTICAEARKIDALVWQEEARRRCFMGISDAMLLT